MSADSLTNQNYLQKIFVKGVKMVFMSLVLKTVMIGILLKEMVVIRLVILKLDILLS